MWAILVAAGSGRRMGGDRPKQYLELAGMTVLERSLRVLESAESVSGIVVVLAPDDRHWAALSLSCRKALLTVKGGAERADSVLAGLTAIAGKCPEEDWVLVHDAARPLLEPRQVDDLEAALFGHTCGGLLAVPLRDTLKRVEAGEVTGTIDRSGYWQAQTPQIYRYRMLADALEQARDRKMQVTDETMAMELIGQRPKVVEGSPENIKITVPADLALAEYLLSRREGSS